ncbi:Uncharacterized protein TCAP_02714 [Tolypocladium capitatum]|uniref:Mid2 domain-containing protein n=1 Tax=Tolypocladium capitatum TaxID=45235 RepID=A0A2K3QIK6_9HYPO|nr:Uncharacterized protein TCAP_02714 [Tolypocladium capitatum]
MRLSLGLALGALLGAAQAGKVVIRQNTAPTSSPRGSPTTTPNTGDTTVVVTQTVTAEGGAVTRFTTTLTTVTSTVVITSTDFSTTTVTSSDQATATKTVYVTSTQFVNQKRGYNPDLTPRTAAPAAANAVATIGVAGGAIGLRKHHLAKRAIITQFTTITVGAGNGGTTVVSSVVNTVKTVVTSATTTTSVVTETDQANAKTTVTVTSTLVVTSTRVTTGVIQTSTGASTSNPDDGGGSDSGGLSTGAKAGIGVGAGLVGLAIIAAIAFFCTRRRRSPKPDHDDFMGASEVPVGGPASGGPGSRGSHPMSESSAPAAGFLAPSRSPVSQSVSPEGYRGTAMGDGRAGYAKPAPFGSAYTQSPGNTMTQQSRNNAAAGDELPRHPAPGDSPVISPATSNSAELGSGGMTASKWHTSNAAEIDSQPVLSHHSGPVYEMPAQEYR